MVLGTESGAVLVVRLDMGEVCHRLGAGSAEGHSSTVNHVVVNEQGTVAYSCSQVFVLCTCTLSTTHPHAHNTHPSLSQDKLIIEWDLQTGTVCCVVCVRTI